jgi:hypothetical protein
MKLNKDKLLKHKFWIVLLLAVPLILGGQFILLVLVAGEIGAEKSKVVTQVKQAKEFKGDVHSPQNSEEKTKQAEDLRKKESIVWADVYASQADSFLWPADIESTYQPRTGKFLREIKYLDAGAAPPVPDDVHHITGRVVSAKAFWIELETKEGKKEKFYQTAPQDMKLDGHAEFGSLSIGKDAQVTFQTGWYFNDRLTQSEQLDYGRSYKTQIRPILEMVEPVNEEGEGVIQFKDWPYSATELPPLGSRFLRFVDKWDVAGHDISDEAWMAQEDLWIQKEIYRLIRQANDYVGKMNPLGEEAKKGKTNVGLNQLARFQNPYFELGLKLVAANKLEYTIRNLQNRRQKLEVTFKVRFSDDPSVPDELVRIDGEPLDPASDSDGKGAKTKGKDTQTKVIDLPFGPRTGIFAVEQALNWETAAVRRIDLISIGSMAEDISLNHRMYPDNVKPLVEPPKEAVAVVEPGNPPAAIPPVPFPQRRGPRGPGFGGGVAPQAADQTTHGLNKNRYIETPTEQSRRLPVAISLIVDQNHIDRVLSSFANSNYRFVLTQLFENRFPTSLKPATLVDPSGLNPVPQPMPGRGAFPPRRGPGFGPGPGGFRPPIIGPGFGGPFGAAGPGVPSGDEEIEGNVELVLYYTVTLYQRYPPRNLPKSEVVVEEKKAP